MKAEIAVMTAENIDRDAIARGGEILKKGRSRGISDRDGIRPWRKCAGPEGIHENICGKGQAF